MHWFIIFVFLASVYGGKETNVDVLKLITDVGEEIFIQWESLSKTNINIEQDRILLESLNNIGRQISRLEILMQTGKDTSPYKQLLQKPQMNRVLQQLHVLAEPLRSIDGFHSTMMQYANLPEATERLTIENFARTCISHGDGALAALLMRIHALVVPDLVENGNLEKSIFAQLAQELEEPSRYLCSLQQSPQQVLYNIYSTITLTEIKGYTMMQFSWMLLKIYGKGNFTLESILARETFEKRSSASLNILKSSLSLISRELWRCDPDNHVEGETYVALTRLLQGYVANEVDLSADHSCCGDCAAYSLTPPRNCHYKNEFCAKQPACSGTLHNCVFIKSKMEVCQANPSSYRRYEWIEYDDGLVLGQKKTCTQGVSKVKSWWTWSLRQCTYCMCMCDQEGPDSHRHFSLQDVTASSDKVVTGIRFTKVNKVIHLQISEGTLLPRGKIDPTSVKWKTFTPVPEPESNPQGRDVDYHTMSYEERSIDLDDLEGPEGTLLTGVRFRKVGSHLNFEIRVTLFNFTTGKLISSLEKSKWINNNAYSILQSRTVLEQQEPTEWRSSFPDSHSGQYLDFTHSDLKTDAAQSTVPFLDSQPAMPLLPVPLSGAGIYHKSYYLYWGFVAPKLFTYDISRHLDNPHPQDTPVDVRFFKEDEQ